ncbi:MAG: CBS domain-containing protein [Nitrospiraceae bacterium]
MPTKKKGRTGTKKEFGVMTVKQVMQKMVQSAHLKTKGDVIASLMIEGFGAVPVVDAKDKLLGIVSEHDLLAALDDGHKLGAVAASDIMTYNPYSVHPETILPTLIHVFRASDLIRVPVVDAKDKLVGIIARRDVLCAYLGRPAEQDAEEVGLLTRPTPACRDTPFPMRHSPSCVVMLLVAGGLFCHDTGSRSAEFRW